MDLMSSLRYAGGAALTGGAASAANVLFGVTVIGLLVFQVGRSTCPASSSFSSSWKIFLIDLRWFSYYPKPPPELVPSPLLCTDEDEEADGPKAPLSTCGRAGM